MTTKNDYKPATVPSMDLRSPVGVPPAALPGFLATRAATHDAAATESAVASRLRLQAVCGGIERCIVTCAVMEATHVVV